MLRGDEDCLPLSWQPKENLTMFTLSHLTLEKLFHTHSHLFVLSECLPLFQVAFPNPPFFLPHLVWRRICTLTV